VDTEADHLEKVVGAPGPAARDGVARLPEGDRVAQEPRQIAGEAAREQEIPRRGHGR
jgi:hypothetical protein